MIIKSSYFIMISTTNANFSGITRQHHSSPFCSCWLNTHVRCGVAVLFGCSVWAVAKVLGVGARFLERAEAALSKLSLLLAMLSSLGDVRVGSMEDMGVDLYGFLSPRARAISLPLSVLPLCRLPLRERLLMWSRLWCWRLCLIFKTFVWSLLCLY
jgi:hypothetical protein